SFVAEPWPRWTFRLPDGSLIEHGLLVAPGRAATALYWRLHEGRGGTLAVRPLVSGRDYHALHHENPAFRFGAEVADGRVVWRPYPGLPAIVARANGSYAQQPDWYRSSLYTEERERGLDHVEDLASPGIFRWDLARGEAVLVLAAEGHEPAEEVAALRAAEGSAGSTPSTRRSGTWWPCTSSWQPGASRRASGRRSWTPSRPSSRVTAPGPATASTSTTTGSSPPASPACSSPGWTPRWAT